MAKTGNPGKIGDFVSDVAEIRRHARQHIEDGAVTEGYRADRETVVRVLNEALATDWCACCGTNVITTWRQAFTRRL